MAPDGDGGGGGGDGQQIVELVIDGDEVVGEGGFLALRRLRLRNRRADGSTSVGYVSDAVARPYGQDAVVACVWTRGADGGVRVLLRDGLRPTIGLHRRAELAPLPERAPSIWLTELVAGVIEDRDRGEAGLRAAAVREIAEEAGFAVAPEAIELLGAGMLGSPGCLAEKFYFVAAEVNPAAQQPLPGDGSPMEEGARTAWWSLDDALAACWRGDLHDCKTELGMRRLRDHLAGRGGPLG